jgi:hypothetical protein
MTLDTSQKIEYSLMYEHVLRYLVANEPKLPDHWMDPMIERYGDKDKLADTDAFPMEPTRFDAGIILALDLLIKKIKYLELELEKLKKTK